MNQDCVDWLYGLSAPMVALNKRYGASYTSPSFFPDRTFVDMESDWGIDSRQALLNCVFNMVDDGHAPILSRYYSMYSRFSESEWCDYCQAQDDYQKVLLAFVEQTFCVCGYGGIRSWDYARMGYLLRNGTTNKYISEEEALWIFSRIAARSQYFYRSWHHYSAGWAIGFQYWETLNNKEDLEALRCELTRASQTHTMKILISDKDSPCNRLPWYTEIDELEKPESLAEYDWS
ncbi:hypothetical protein A9G45_12160 [Gilliamella sp. HK2]|jgi:hypothetical protein|uniref:DUF1266 domain-containing protein n=1 Tax=unclassified Gilliamella TaxID=2685620 RepID=UPI00080D90AF|nr:DUF1266 domain-containing protein [Gilliamella apicola]OCG23503.1 hypothetical protein A9G46_09895 [Gilliamella apicola]OCG32108.1 hypothetical protein A9G45_12160 [Gilliamella apicola]